MSINPGRFTTATIHSEAGEVEVRLSEAGNWELRLRGDGECEWRMACSGDVMGGAVARQAPAPVRPVRLGALTVDSGARRASVDGTELALTAREFGLLVALASEPNRVFSKQELQRDVFGYGDAAVKTRTVDSHASRLRVKLREAGAGEMVINCWGVGYRLWQGAPLKQAEARLAA